ncbi:MAG: hypothetical protein ACRC18_06585 [Cetobacterium sp.]
MIFTKEFLKEKTYKPVYEEVTDTTRWSIHKMMVFEHEGKHYKAYYSEGATECQCEYPFEYDDDEIECPEVEFKEVVVKKWVEIQ